MLERNNNKLPGKRRRVIQRPIKLNSNRWVGRKEQRRRSKGGVGGEVGLVVRWGSGVVRW